MECAADILMQAQDSMATNCTVGALMQALDALAAGGGGRHRQLGHCQPLH